MYLAPPKERLIRYTTFNARVEEVRDKAAFRESLRYGRCIIPAMGWYEWQELKGGNLPWYLHGGQEELLNFAGLWANWTDKASGEVVESCAIMVGPANKAFWNIHDRMPFILDTETALAWMDRGQTDADQALGLLKMNPDDLVKFHRVSKRVNKGGAFDDPDLALPLEGDDPFDVKPAPRPRAVQKKPPEPKAPPPTTGDLFGEGE